MPPVPTTSPVTGKPLHPSYLHTTSLNFVDNAGRTLLLRGVNLSGASKAPVDHLSYLLEDFWESAEDGGESFVGRPLNIEDGSADVHLARLRGWGFNLLRFPFTWEALEHQGPGKYDTEFMDYTIRVLCKCRDYGFRVYMDPHQDTWSRFSGGSGAPYWTLAACGINARNITATQAAIIHCEYPLAHDPDPASLPAMVWSTNYGRLLSQTVFTLFFAGRDFAPNCIIDGINIQDYLQNHYIEACGQLADRIKAFDNGSLFEECIIGWDSMNEPFEGLCEWEDLNTNPNKQGSTLKKGSYPTPAQSLRLGMGKAQTVDNWEFGKMGPSKNGTVTIDPKGYKLWADPISSSSAPSASGQRNNHDTDPHEPPENHPIVGELPDGTHPRWGWKRDVGKWPLGTCIWAQHGVWDIETGFILRPDYFRFNPITGIEIEFLSDYWKPHWIAYAQRVRQSHEEAIVFVQPPVFAPPPRFTEDELKGRCAYSPHYYDGLTLVTRHWNWFNADALGLLRGKYSSTLQAVKIGETAIRKSLHEQLGYLQADVASLGDAVYPTVIGEIGTPFDMDHKRSYGWTDGGKYKGQYGNQEKALDASLNACDAWADEKGNGSLNWTVWTYVGDDHSHEWGDGWNMEDLSLWSPDDLVGDEDEGDEDEIYNALEEMDSMTMDEDALNSRAALLEDAAQKKRQQKQPGRSLPMRAMSSLSLATLDESSASGTNVKASNVKQRLGRSAIRSTSRPSLATNSSASSISTSSRRSRSWGIAGYSSNPYTLLTNGARAVRAFARPWPVKVVGRATDVRFDIGKGLFKMIVSVGWDDRIRCPPSSSSVVTSTKKEGFGAEVGVQPVQDSETDEGLATEVYIPLVHYAHARLLEDKTEKPRLGRRQSKRRWVRKDGGDSASISSVGSSVREGERAQTTAEGVHVHPLSMSVLTTTTAASSDSEPGSRHSLHSGTTAVDGRPTDIELDVVEPNNVLTRSMGAPLLIRDSTPDLVDVEVKISGGRFVVRGQTLFWWYDVPSTENEPRKEYTLEVKRRGGVLKPRTTKGRKMAEEGGSVWCEELCPEDGVGGCVIA